MCRTMPGEITYATSLCCMCARGCVCVAIFFLLHALPNKNQESMGTSSYPQVLRLGRAGAMRWCLPMDTFPDEASAGVKPISCRWDFTQQTCGVYHILMGILWDIDITSKEHRTCFYPVLIGMQPCFPYDTDVQPANMMVSQPQIRIYLMTDCFWKDSEMNY